MPKRRTLEERAEFMSAEEVSVLVGMHPRALKRRIRSGAVSAPAKYTEENRYLFTAEEVDRIRDELGVGRPLAAFGRGVRGIDPSTFDALAQIGAATPAFEPSAAVMKQFEALGARIAMNEAATGMNVQLRVQEDLARRMSEAFNAPTETMQRAFDAPAHALQRAFDAPAEALHRAAEGHARQLEEAMRSFRSPETVRWIEQLEDRVREIGTIEARGPVVSPGQVAAFADAGDSRIEVRLEDLLGELRETNRLLRVLLETRGMNPGHAQQRSSPLHQPEPEGGSTYRE